MIFHIINRHQPLPHNSKSIVYLVWDSWNDYSFLTYFGIIYVDENSEPHDLGGLKIGYFGQQERERKLSTGDTFEQLGSEFFSLGQDDLYYEKINSFGDQIRDGILNGLNDIAKNPDIYKKAIKERVTKTSLLRTVSPKTVTGQFRRLANGGAKLTDFSFKFLAPRNKDNSARMELSFNVIPESSPPTNIHVVIGRNGVGKTHLLNSMLSTLLDKSFKSGTKGEFLNELDKKDVNIFANIISVTFSAFDETEPQKEIRDKTKGIQFAYIGLKRIQIGNEKNLGPKSTVILKNEFYNSLMACRNSSKYIRWNESIKMLESDPNFKEANVLSLFEIENENELKILAFDIFRRLSSGHKIVLLTITRLIETLQEKSLVLIDEPEAHLHPPLLSAFARTLSELLISLNGVAIIATHSPVILQEVPKSCVWKLRRTGALAIAERLKIESFGENVGTLTNEVFGLEVTHSGYYKLLSEAVLETSDYQTDYQSVLTRFSNQLGLEAKAVLMSILANKN